MNLPADLHELSQVQLVQLDLLAELDDICRRHGIEYSLSGVWALDYIRNRQLTSDSTDIEVFMTPVNFDKWRKLPISELPADRASESIFSNPYYPALQARYCSTLTTFYNLLTPQYSEHGIHVTIRVATLPINRSGLHRYLNRKFRSKLGAVKRYSSLLPSGFRVLFRPMAALHNFILKRDLRAAIQADSEVRMGQRAAKYKISDHKNKISFDVPGEEIQNNTPIVIGGVLCQLNHWLSVNLLASKPSYRARNLSSKEAVHVIANPREPFKVFLKRVGRWKILTARYAHVRERMLLKKIRTVDQNKFSHSKFMFRYSLKFREFQLRHMYADRNADLVRLLNTGDFDALERELSDYDFYFSYYYRRKQILVFDLTALTALMALYEHRGRKGVSDRVYKSIVKSRAVR